MADMTLTCATEITDGGYFCSQTEQGPVVNHYPQPVRRRVVEDTIDSRTSIAHRHGAHKSSPRALQNYSLESPYVSLRADLLQPRFHGSQKNLFFAEAKQVDVAICGHPQPLSSSH